MNRDNDVIRGLGYVTIQSSHLESSIEEIAQWLAIARSRPMHHETFRVSEKIKWCKDVIKLLNTEKLEELDRSLDGALNLINKRNEFVHGRIYFPYDCIAPEKLIPTKKGQRERNINASELYDLAEDLYNLHVRIVSENSFKLLHTLGPILDA